MKRWSFARAIGSIMNDNSFAGAIFIGLFCGTIFLGILYALPYVINFVAKWDHIFFLIIPVFMVYYIYKMGMKGD